MLHGSAGASPSRGLVQLGGSLSLHWFWRGSAAPLPPGVFRSTFILRSMFKGDSTRLGGSLSLHRFSGQRLK